MADRWWFSADSRANPGFGVGFLPIGSWGHITPLKPTLTVQKTMTGFQTTLRRTIENGQPTDAATLFK